MQLQWMGSETGNFNTEKFMEWALLCLFPYIEEQRERLHSPNERAVLLLDNCAIHVIDELKIEFSPHNISMLIFPTNSTRFLQPSDLLTFSVLKKNTSRKRVAITNLAPESNEYNITDAHGKSTSLGTTQIAFKMAGIGYKVKVGKLVASIMTEAFNKILKSVKSDNVMASGPLPPPKRRVMKKTFGQVNKTEMETDD
ncbi:MAG: hypothetical protein EZS28_006507 [Streblomastix strix]|uniref:DDE-1 domain-containing protein n=1 Tax=Streblomastix strix TaxID=222440 RepID=A0A5J4WUV7_9EUKA|nr:MAG: hypothetical protein EZS28_006507 [Streblomastix strix]